jgi:outer membrane protein assembly factor BamD (BamD/ComL family)
MPLVCRQVPPERRRCAAARALRHALAQALALAVLLAAQGCSSTGGGLISLWRQGTDSSLSKPPTPEEINDNRNLLARWLTPKMNPHANPDAINPPSTLILGSNGYKPMQPPKNPEADAELEVGERLFQQGKFEEAQPVFARIARNRKSSPWGEKAQYFLAESYYQRGKLVDANNCYEKLVADYPGTEFLDRLVSREYQIAQVWLAQVDAKAKPEERLPWYTRFTREQPWIDTRGFGIQALEHVRQHDPTGPLADDAVLRIADEHMSTRDYESAALYYDQLITDHPKSPFLQRAQLAAIDARIKGYLGPDYDGNGLEQARELIKSTMSAFPDRPAGNEKLYHTLDLINDQEAERAFKIGDYYQRTGRVISAEYYFGKIRQRWPKSPWATQAKTRLAALAKMPHKQSAPSKINIGRFAGDPFASSGGVNGMNGPNGGMMNGMGMPGGMGGMGMPGMGAPGGMY